MIESGWFFDKKCLPKSKSCTNKIRIELEDFSDSSCAKEEYRSYNRNKITKLKCRTIKI